MHKKGILYHYTKVSENPDCLEVSVGFKNDFINIVNFYTPPADNNVTEDVLHRILNRKKALIGGDINATSFLLGSETLDQRYKIFEKLLDDLHLIPLNTGAGTHPTNLGKLSPIDVTLACPRFAVKASWEVFEDDLGSDHILIKITLPPPSNTENILPLKINLKKNGLE